MNKLMAYVLLAAGVSLLFFGCSKKSSNEACVHQASTDLDHGNYDAVLASGCADAMQKGAAYFGKAGFDIKGVINRFSETGVTSNATTTTSSDLAIYMTALVGMADANSLTNLDNSKTEYNSVPTSSDSYKDAQFYMSLVDAIKSLSLLKMILDINGDGTITNTCDKNNNNKPDQIDATGCAFLVSAGTATSTCTGGRTVDTDHPNIKITDSSNPSQNYRGLIISVSGVGTNVSGCPNPNQYRHLLYPQSSTVWAVVTTAPGPASCHGSDGLMWPCPILDQNGRPLDMVSAFDTSLNGAISSLNTSLTTTTSNDVSTAIQDIKTTACPTGACTSSDIADYLQTYHQ